MRKRKRKLHEIDPDYPNSDPNKMTVPELRLHLMQYNVSHSRNASKKKLIELYQEKIATTQRSAKRARTGDKRPFAGLVPLGAKPKSNKRKRGNEDEEKEEPKRQIRKLTRLPMIRPKKSSANALSRTQQPALAASSAPSSVGKRRLARLPAIKGGPASRRAATSSPAGPAMGQFDDDDTLLNPQSYAPPANQFGGRRTPRQSSFGVLRESECKVVGNALVYNGQSFSVGDKVLYRGDEWLINSIDFASHSCDIKKGSRIVNITPTKITPCEEEANGMDDDVPQTPAPRRGSASGSKAFSGLVPGNVPQPPKKIRKLSFCALLAVAMLTAVFYHVATVPQLIFCDFDEQAINGLASSDCVSCPDRATCRNGKATCWNGYQLRGRTCLKTKEYKRELKNVIETAAEVLAEHRGAVECQLGLDPNEREVADLAQLSTDEIKERVLARMHLNDSDFRAHDKFAGLYRNAMHEFKEHFSISGGLLTRTGRKYYSNVSKKTWGCLAWELFARNPLKWTSGILGGIFTIWAYSRFLGLQRKWHYTEPMGKKVQERIFTMLQTAALQLEPCIPVAKKNPS